MEVFILIPLQSNTEVDKTILQLDNIFDKLINIISTSLSWQNTLSHMTVEERKALKQKIEEHIIEVKADIIEIEKMTQPVKPENSLGRISRMDAINNKSVAEASLRNKKAKLTKLNVAVVKVDEEGFGYCQMCKNQIQPMRLMFMPESSRCVRCAAR